MYRAGKEFGVGKPTPYILGNGMGKFNIIFIIGSLLFGIGIANAQFVSSSNYQIFNPNSLLTT
jgi:hypothetical protein